MSTRVRIALVATLLPLLAFGAQPALADDEVASVESVASADPAGEVFPAPPPQDISLVVFGGGSTDDVLKTFGCPSGRPASLWTYFDGSAVFYSPAADPEFRAPWESRFFEGIPALTAIGVDCR